MCLMINQVAVNMAAIIISHQNFRHKDKSHVYIGFESTVILVLMAVGMDALSNSTRDWLGMLRDRLALLFGMKITRA